MIRLLTPCTNSGLFLTLCRKVPRVQVPGAMAEVIGEAEPCKVWSQQPARRLVHLAPDISQVAHRACQSNDIGAGSYRLLQAKEERCPDQVQRQLNGVQGCAMLWNGLV